MQARHFPQRVWRVKVCYRNVSFNEILQRLGECVAHRAEWRIVTFRIGLSVCQ